MLKILAIQGNPGNPGESWQSRGISHGHHQDIPFPLWSTSCFGSVLIISPTKFWKHPSVRFRSIQPGGPLEHLRRWASFRAEHNWPGGECGLQMTEQKGPLLAWCLAKLAVRRTAGNHLDSALHLPVAVTGNGTSASLSIMLKSTSPNH